MRVPPNAVRSTTMPSGSAAISPMTDGRRAERVGAQRGERGVGLVGRHDGDDLALVGDVQRVDAEQVAGAERRPASTGSAVSSSTTARPASRASSLQTVPTPAAGRVAQPAGAGRGGEQRLDEPVHRRRVGADVGLEGEVAAGEHHRHAVVADRARHEHPVARLDQLGAERAIRRGSRRRPAVVM